MYRKQIDVSRAPLHRRWSARRDLRHAEHARDTAADTHQHAASAAAPALAARDDARSALTGARAAVDAAKYDAWAAPVQERSGMIQRAIDGLDTWQRWADGHNLSAKHVYSG